jgi:L,D-transpeptidase YcbB
MLVKRTGPVPNQGKGLRLGPRQGWLTAPLAWWLASAVTASAAEPPMALFEATATAGRDRASYVVHGWSAGWSERDVEELTAALKHADRHAIDASQLLANITAARDGRERDVACTKAALAYAAMLSKGLVDPTFIHSIFTLERNEVDVALGLQKALADGRVHAWLDSLAPNDSEYRRLSEAYVRLSAMQAEPDIAAGPLIKPGESDARIPEIAHRLSELGFMNFSVPLEGKVYSADVRFGVEALQKAHGLTVDGVIGQGTLAVLNAGPRDHARQLAVNLERRRWAARQMPGRRIDVNLPAATLRYYRAGDIVWTTPVVVGRPTNRTPVLQESFDSLVVNPPWYVPESIARREILPQGPSYLRRNNMVLRNGTVVQRPGPEAALGQVKFDMRNPYAIYLHDTPAKALFERQDRYFSHGCVRVGDAVEFARRLAAEDGKGEVFEAALASGRTQTIDLGRSTPVRLLYRTAYVDLEGRLAFRPDVYGWDEQLASAMNLGSATVSAPLREL